MWRNNLKVAIRTLQKNQTIGVINLIGLSIGIAIAIIIGLWINDELTYDQYHKNYDRLAQLYLSQTGNNGVVRTSEAVSLPTAPTLRTDFSGDIEDLSLASWRFEHILSYEDQKLLKDGLFVESGFPKMFSLEFEKGNIESALKDIHSIVISTTLAEALFGDQDPMGKTIRFDAVTDLEVKGVYKPLPPNSSLSGVEFYATWQYYQNNNEWIIDELDNWANHSFQLFAQVKDHVDIDNLSKRIRDIEKPYNAALNPEYFLLPMKKWHLYADFRNGVIYGGRIQYVRMFGLIGVFVLILACINFMNLNTARSSKRAREVGIRKTVGSQKGELIRQFLAESLVLTILSYFFALVIVLATLDAFNEFAEKSLELPWLNPMFWGLSLLLCLVTGILAGSYPAFYLSSLKVLNVLKGELVSGKWASVPRQLLVVFQFTVSIALIIGTIVVFQQIQHAKNRPIGYDREGVIQFFSNYELLPKGDLFRDELIRSGAAEEVCYAMSPITNIWSNQTNFEWEGKDPEDIISFGVNSCSPEYGKTINWNIVSGRDFSREFTTDTLSLILNESAVELTGIENVVGQTIRYRGVPHTVIGVVEDMVMGSPWRPAKPTIFYLDPEYPNLYLIKLNSQLDTRSALAGVESVFKRFSPSSPFTFDFVDDQYARKFEDEERIGKLSQLFALLAIFISCLGLFGLSTYVAERRTKEIGIRKVLGATIAGLWVLQSKQFIKLILIACVIATPLAWYFLEEWLVQYDYRIQLEWQFFSLAGLIVLAVTMFTVSFQSLKAALVNPIDSLRNE